MNAISSKELKQRGVVALEDKLARGGPLYVMKRNTTTCVVLRVEEYESLLHQQPIAQPLLKILATFGPARKGQSAKTLAKRLHRARSDWGPSA